MKRPVIILFFVVYCLSLPRRDFLRFETTSFVQQPNMSRKLGPCFCNTLVRTAGTGPFAFAQGRIYIRTPSTLYLYQIGHIPVKRNFRTNSVAFSMVIRDNRRISALVGPAEKPAKTIFTPRYQGRWRASFLYFLGSTRLACLFVPTDRHRRSDNKKPRLGRG